MPVIEAHLTPAVRARLGAPDVRLIIGDAAFPVDRAYVAANSGVLASLLKGCATAEEAEVALFQASRTHAACRARAHGQQRCATVDNVHARASLK